MEEITHRLYEGKTILIDDELFESLKTLDSDFEIYEAFEGEGGLRNTTIHISETSLGCRTSFWNGEVHILVHDSRTAYTWQPTNDFKTVNTANNLFKSIGHQLAAMDHRRNTFLHDFMSATRRFEKSETDLITSFYIRERERMRRDRELEDENNDQPGHGRQEVQDQIDDEETPLSRSIQHVDEYEENEINRGNFFPPYNEEEERFQQGQNMEQGNENETDQDAEEHDDETDQEDNDDDDDVTDMESDEEHQQNQDNDDDDDETDQEDDDDDDDVTDMESDEEHQQEQDNDEDDVRFIEEVITIEDDEDDEDSAVFVFEFEFSRYD